jgi:hypothetical protein
MDPIMLTRAQYAAHHGKSDRTVQRWLERELLPGVQKTPAGEWRIPSDVLPLLDEHTGRTVATTPRAVAPAAPRAWTLDAALSVLPAYLTVEQAANLLGLNERTVLRNAPRWDGEKIGGESGRAWMIPAAAVRKVAGL